MPRRHKRQHPGEADPPRLTGSSPVAAPHGWQANSHPGSADRTWVCPYCHQQFGAAHHVVVWPSGDPDARRHWHRKCFDAAVREGLDRYRLA